MGNCESCGHERVHHRRTDMIGPEPCSAHMEDKGLAGRCGCRAAFEVDAERGALARVAGLLAGTLTAARGTARIIVEHRPVTPGPPWHLTLEEYHHGERMNTRIALTASEFSLAEAVDKLAEQAEVGRG